MNRIGLLISATALAFAAPALAAPAAQPAPAPAVDALTDAARLAAAQSVANTVFPDGTYKRIMGTAMSKLMDGMLGSMMKMPVRDVAAMTGLSRDRLSQLSDGSMTEVAAIIDPHFRDRTKLMMDTMFASMGDLMSQFEPKLRAALTRSFARKFDLQELTAISGFFATPTGGKFAADYMTMFMEPEIMGEMQGMMPEMMKKMPELIGPAIKAAEQLPPARKFSDLSAAEQGRLAELLGMTTADLKKSAAHAEKEAKQ